MNNKEKVTQKRLQYARILLILMTLGIIILSMQSLFTGWLYFQYFALGVAVLGLGVISLIVARIVNSQD